MDDLHKHLAIMAILAQRSMMAFVDLLAVNLTSESQEARDWALDSLREYGELRLSQMNSGFYGTENDNVIEFLKSVGEPEKIVVGFSLN